MRYYLYQKVVEPRSPFSLYAETVWPAIQYMFFYLHPGFTGSVGVGNELAVERIFRAVSIECGRNISGTQIIYVVI